MKSVDRRERRVSSLHHKQQKGLITSLQTTEGSHHFTTSNRSRWLEI
jgi:hypothetical protein